MRLHGIRYASPCQRFWYHLVPDSLTSSVGEGSQFLAQQVAHRSRDRLAAVARQSSKGCGIGRRKTQVNLFHWRQAARPRRSRWLIPRHRRLQRWLTSQVPRLLEAHSAGTSRILNGGTLRYRTAGGRRHAVCSHGGSGFPCSLPLPCARGEARRLAPFARRSVCPSQSYPLINAHNLQPAGSAKLGCGIQGGKVEQLAYLVRSVAIP
jgi:hypothetical protein